MITSSICDMVFKGGRSPRHRPTFFPYRGWGAAGWWIMPQ